MVIWNEEYCISTLVKPDPEHIKKVQEILHSDMKQLFQLHPDYEGKILISKKPIMRRHVIKLKDREIETCRLEWMIRGDKDILETLLREWKQMDFNPWRSFHIHREYSLSQLRELMSIE